MKVLEPYELLDLQEAVLELLPSKILPAITKANRTGELEELLRLLGMEELIDKEGEEAFTPTRIIVIGDSMISEQRLRSIAKKKAMTHRTLSSCLVTTSSNTVILINFAGPKACEQYW